MKHAVGTCIKRTGFRQVPHRGTGVSRLHARVSSGLMRDRQEWPLVALRPWNADVDTDAELVRNAGAGLHIEVDYSYGAGEGLAKFGPALAKLCPQKPIDLAILIDPVTRYRWFKWRSLRHGGAFRVPDNVRRVAVFRSVNQPRWTTPVGHAVSVGPDTRVVAEVAWGSRDNLRRHVGIGVEKILAPDVDHMNIDDLPEVHDRAVVLIERLINGDL